jgi:hypothetical protein
MLIQTVLKNERGKRNEDYGKFKPRRYNDINSPQNPETSA